MRRPAPGLPWAIARPEQRRQASGALPRLFLTAAPLALLVGLMFFFRLDFYPVRDNNEGLYAEIAREMLASGNYIVPHLNGVPYIEKPPLLYWLMALCDHLFGVSTGASRLVPALAMGSLCLYLPYRGARLGAGRLGWLAALILASSVPLVLLARTVLFDPLLTALLAFALLQFFCWSEDPRLGKLLLAYGAVGLAVLAKGFVALVLAGGPVLLWLLLDAPRRALLRRLFHPAAVSLLILLVVPWHVAASLSQPGFAWFYLINEHVLRFLGRRQPFDYHTGPFYYYLWRAPLLLTPWVPFLAVARARMPAAPAWQRRLEQFCGVWFLFGLVFFSVSTAKGDYYMIVAMPALVLWLASRCERLIQSGRLVLLRRCTLFLPVCTLFMLAVVAWPTGPWLTRLDLAPGLHTPLMLTLVAMTALYLAAYGLMRSEQPRAAFCAIGFSAVCILLFVLQALQANALRTSCAEIAAFLHQPQLAEEPVYSYRDYEDVVSSLRFLSSAPLWIVDSASSDLQFGCRHPDGASPCVPLQRLADTEKAHPVIVIASDGRLAEFITAFGAQDFQWMRHFGRKWVIQLARSTTRP